MLRHDLLIWLQIQTFYNGLGATNRSMIDATVVEVLMSKTPEVAYGLMEELASNNYWQTSKKTKPKQVASILELDQMSNIHAQFASLNKRFDNLKKRSVSGA